MRQETGQSKCSNITHSQMWMMVHFVRIWKWQNHQKKLSERKSPKYDRTYIVINYHVIRWPKLTSNVMKNDLFNVKKIKMGKVTGISRFRLHSIKLIKIMISHFWLIYPVWVWHWLMTQLGEAQLITHDWEKLLEDHGGLMDTLQCTLQYV